MKEESRIICQQFVTICCRFAHVLNIASISGCVYTSNLMEDRTISSGSVGRLSNLRLRLLLFVSSFILQNCHIFKF